MSELKACPAGHEQAFYNHGRPNLIWVECDACEWSGPPAQTEKEAAEFWNRRTEPNEVLTVEAALEMFDCDGCIDYHTFWGKEPCFHCLRNSKRTDELADCYRHKPEESEGEG